VFVMAECFAKILGFVNEFGLHPIPL